MEVFLKFGDNDNCCTLVGNFSTESENNDNDFISDSISTMNAGEFYLKVDKMLEKGKYVKTHVVLNQFGSLITHSNHKIKGYIQQKNYLQSLCETKTVESIPLLFPEAMVFISILYPMMMFQVHFQHPKML